MISHKIPPIILLLLALRLLKDEDSNVLAVVIALQRHPPALRVFRALFEISLIIFAAALSVHVWTNAVGQKVVGQLLFRSPTRMEEQRHGRYQPISGDDQDEVRVDYDDDSEDDKVVSGPRLQKHDSYLSGDGMDADYASDGEISEGVGLCEPDSEAYPPTSLEVLEIAVDLFLWVLVFLFLFTVSSAGGGKYIKGMQGATESQLMASIAAPLFPLFLFVGALMRTIFPWSKRKSIWIILFTTIGAPFCTATFRDGFVGDVLTSSVRPMQDVAFTIFYVLSGLRGWWSDAYNLDDAALPVERSWIVRTVVLPLCMVSPLWWRFNQNLRQVWDAKKRWPYLGNAFKYLAAAEVAMFGVFDPTRRTSPVWLVCAIVATLYQVWWDVVMDWELIRLERHSKFSTLRLREQRLYGSKWMYWTILVINIILRFGWTMTFFPKHFLDRTGALRSTFEGIFIYIDPLLASAEILRRMLWGFIRLELEAIKSHANDPKVNERLRKCCDSDDYSGDVELKSMELHDRIPRPLYDDGVMEFDLSNDLGDKSSMQIILELCLWTGVFLAGGAIAAARRGTF